MADRKIYSLITLFFLNDTGGRQFKFSLFLSTRTGQSDTSASLSDHNMTTCIYTVGPIQALIVFAY